MYARLTVNLSHLASRLILTLLDQGTTEIDADRFHGLLYRAFKKIQSEPSIHLHRSLTDPEGYRGVHDGSSALWSQFRDAAWHRVSSQPMRRHTGSCRLCGSENGGRDPRLENVVQVYANELASLAACRAGSSTGCPLEGPIEQAGAGQASVR